MAVLSCEEDFTNIDSSVLTNTKFTTSSTLEYITAKNSPLERVQSDNISRRLGQYLLGVYASSDYEKLEASIVSQVAITTGLQVIDDENIYGADTTVVTKMDTVFLKIPYQVSLNDDGDAYVLDSIIGDPTKAFNLNIYRSNTYLNVYNPEDPSKINRFYSNDVFEKIGDRLNVDADFPLIPSVNDTTLIVKRKLFDDSIATTDTVEIFSSAISTLKIPFIRIPLDEDKFKELFLDKLESSEFESQDAFNNYFRGLIIEATGTEGSLISFNFNNTNTDLNPSIEAYYTNTVLKSGSIVLDTITKNNSFPLSGFRVNTFAMDDKVYPDNDEIIIQGTAGSEGTITLFDEDKIKELRDRNLLINDASLILYINQSADTAHVPDRLYLYQDNTGVNAGFGQIKDSYREQLFFGGELQRDANGTIEKYTFRITKHVSDLLSGESNYSPNFKLKAFNITDFPSSIPLPNTVSATDTIFNNFSWNPKAVTLFNSTTANTAKKAVLKISYSEDNN
ncbi:DUF4270 domain-containing protein [Polaribacter sp. R77954]|uniref:DUF4270 domain-containing protein n=1 Tax=Polaribacter sp. R77954 TaxID=3093870 RepID=UPI0037CA4509